MYKKVQNDAKKFKQCYYYATLIFREIGGYKPLTQDFLSLRQF